MRRLGTSKPMTAVIYGDGEDIDSMMQRIALLLEDDGVSLAGFVQRNAPRSGRRRCDMVLRDLVSGEKFAISEDRGPMARGCHLDVGELLRATEIGRQGLARGAELLIVNKFGKTEGEGGGFRPLIADALFREIPVLTAVPWRNIDAWRHFAEDLSNEVPLASLSTGTELLAQLGFSCVRRERFPTNRHRSTLHERSDDI